MLIIPDTHGRTFWKECVETKRENEIVVFLGDYLEPYSNSIENISHEEAYQNLIEIIDYKKSHKEDCILLLGNHDFACINPKMISCRHDYINEKRNTKLFFDNLDLFQIGYSVDINGIRYMMTHSGIRKGWYDTIFKSEEFENAEPISFLNNMFCKDRKNLENYLNVISKYREYFGYDEGSCIWSDAREWFNDKEPQFPNTYQIFGHSQLRSEPIVTQWWADLDCRRAFRLNEENGNIEELNGKEKIKEHIS